VCLGSVSWGWVEKGCGACVEDLRVAPWCALKLSTTQEGGESEGWKERFRGRKEQCFNLILCNAAPTVLAHLSAQHAP
jgi:hypothetical protein